MSATPDKPSNFEASAASDDSIREVHARLQSQKPDKAHGYSALPLVLRYSGHGRGFRAEHNDHREERRPFRLPLR